MKSKTNHAATTPTRAAQPGFCRNCPPSFHDNPNARTSATPRRETTLRNTDNRTYPERFAQQALGHNSKAVHHACSKHAEVTVPSLDDWEKHWQENQQRIVQPKLLSVDFRSAASR